MYITFEEYTALGGTVELSAFPLLERLAEKKLNYWTFKRITEDTEITEDIKLAMALIINSLEQAQGDKVSSFSNDGISVSFVDEDDTQKLYQQVLEILPHELMKWV